MKATRWMGKQNIEVEDVPDPQLQEPTDIIVRITSTAICGSDLHLYNGFMPTMEKGDILGHEFMGEVMEVGSEVRNLSVGDRVVVPFTISCGHCWYCRNELYSLCDTSNPNAEMAATLWGYSPAGIFGYSHTLGGFPGGQAEYARVPYGDVGPIKVPAGMSDDQALFLSDIFPTGWMAAENCNIQPGQTVAVWGCGPVGQFAIASAFLMGAERVIAIDRFEERLAMARSAGAETIDYEDEDRVLSTLKEMTGNQGPDACIEAVGMEAHGHSFEYAVDRVKQALMVETGRPIALRQAILGCRKGGVVSCAGVFGGFIDTFPMGAVVNKSLTIKAGQTHVQHYMRPLLERIEAGDIDPSFVITHHLPLAEAAHGYEIFSKKEEGCIKVVLKP